MSADIDRGTSFEFSGNWREFAPIAVTNILLTLVTLGFYRFWAVTRERRYFWQHTRFIDDQLEWTGTGKELFLGFLMVFVVLFLPLLLVQFATQALIFRGQLALAGLLFITLYLFLFFLVGIAAFRGLRYRLSRTLWHGIRGGSEDNGVRYGVSYLWKTVAGLLPLGLLIPRANVSLWKERWSRMSFGPHAFTSAPQWQGLMKRYLILYLLPGIAFILGVVAALADGWQSGLGATFFIALGIAYIALPFVALGYYAAYLREVIGTLSLAGLDFRFDARTKNWFWLMLGNLGIYAFAVGIAAALFGLLSGGSIFEHLVPQPGTAPNPLATIGLFAIVIAPLALIGPFLRYRSWAFFIRHMEATGEVSLRGLTQSTTETSRHGEGLLDAFDMGAI